MFVFTFQVMVVSWNWYFFEDVCGEMEIPWFEEVKKNIYIAYNKYNIFVDMGKKHFQ